MGRSSVRRIGSLKTRQLWFTEPFRVEVQEHQLHSPGADQVLVKSLYSGISTGTEMLLYRGQLPESLPLDESLAAYQNQTTSFPLQYGYAAVGQVVSVGRDVEQSWTGKTVFSFQPHASHFLCSTDMLIPLPDELDPRAAIFLASMETAVNLVLDGRPLLGEKVVVIGQGVVGLLASCLLGEFPLAGLFAVESIDNRRAFATQAGVHATFNPECASDIDALIRNLSLHQPRGGADLVFELSGSPAALNLAVKLCGYGGRIVVGSWYGTKTAELKLGDRFHRNRMSIVSSQVSTIAPGLSGRWDKSRRFDLAWEMIRKCQPEQFITHCMPLEAAIETYRLLHEAPQDALQVIFDYRD
jgi:2-desacetyl-2-hydroxyethyl bacteriochlorophyllide A dehydrogenase